MKKILFLTSLLTLSFSIAQAQISRGTSLVGGSIGYNRSTNESKYVGSAIPAGPNPIEITYQNFNINPNAGYFIADNLVAGVSFGFGTTKEIRPYASSADPARPNKLITKSTIYNVAPFLRYYYFPIENFGFYSQLSAGLNRQTSTTTFDELDDERQRKTNGGGVSITPAFVFFPTSKLGLELTAGSIGYFRTRTKPSGLQQGQYDNETKTSSFGANFGLSSLTLGASYYIGRQ